MLLPKEYGDAKPSGCLDHNLLAAARCFRDVSSTPTNPSPMNFRSSQPTVGPVRFSIIILAVILQHAPLVGQLLEPKAQVASPSVSAAETTAPTSGPEKSREVIELSPFVVRTERDTGFIAASSLAGGRFATELKDTAAAYSVLTRDFLDALNLIDTEDALTWAVGTDKLKDNGSDKIFYTDAGSNVRSRGVHVRGVQRNFFLLGLSSDTYSQERIDFARSPSALLVGNSGLGGSIISLTKRAQPSRSFAAVGLTVGSYGEKRATLDVNRALTADLAVRVNVLGQDSNDWRDDVFDRRKGAHLAATFRPRRNTEIRVEWENYRNESVQTFSSPLDRITGWDGVTVVNGPATTVANSTAAGLSRLGSSTAEYIVFVPALDGGRIINYANTWTTRGGGEAAGITVGGVTPFSTTNLGVAGASITDDSTLAADRFDLAEANSAFVRPGREFVIGPDAPTVVYNFRDAAVFVEQQVGEHLFFEAAANQADTLRKTEYIVTRGVNDVRLDVNRLLPTGAANPFFLQPYGEAANGHTYFRNEIFDYRAAGAAVFDGTRWGSFRANVIAGNRRNKQFISQLTDVLDRSNDLRERPFNDLVTYRYYWNAERPFYRPQSITYENPTGTTSTYNVVDMIDLRFPGNNRTADTRFTYLQGAVNGKLFNGRLNLLGGVRRDRLQVDSRAVTTQPRRDYPTDWNGQTIYYLPEAPVDYFTLTYVPKNASGAPTGIQQSALSRPRDSLGNPLPQYAADRFRSDYSAPAIDQTVTTITGGGVVHVLPWLSGFYNYAETFNPSVVGQTVTGELLPAQLSEGWDAGVRFTFLGGRVTATATAYDSTQVNNAFDAGSSISGILTNIVEANPKGDQSPTGRNTRGLGAIPSPYFDFQDLAAEGYEFEMVANLTKEWRLTVNYARPKVYNTNRYTDTFAYLATNEGTLREIVLDSGGLIGANEVAAVDPSAPQVQQSPDVASAVTAWNNLQSFKVTNALSNVNPNATHDYMWNLFTDYRFRKGFLKGVKIGGGAQYRGKKSIGNRSLDTLVDPSNPSAAIDDPAVNASSFVYMPGYTTATVVVGYERPLRRGLALSIDLRINNLLNEDRLIYVSTTLRPPGGNLSSPARVTVPSNYYLLEPRTFSVTTTLRF